MVNLSTDIFCVQTLIQVKETSKVTLARGFFGLLVLLVGMEFFVFSVILASVLLARLCKAGVNLATTGQGRRQFLSCEVDGRGPFLFAAINDQ